MQHLWRILTSRGLFWFWKHFFLLTFGLFSFARFLKLIFDVRQQSIEICNACRYGSTLVVYCVNSIRLNDFTIEICVFHCGACHWFYRYTDAFLWCIFDNVLECDILWMYLFLPYFVRKWHNKTVQSINQSINQRHKDVCQGESDIFDIQVDPL